MGSEVTICSLDELPDAAGRAVRAEGRQIALFRVGDEVFALDNICPHYGGPLAEGIVSAERLEIACPWHRFRYDLRTGECVAANLRPAVTTYKVTVRDNAVIVTLDENEN